MVKMKDSGIEWIGEIPETWKVTPLYMCFTERRNKNRLGKEKNLLSLSYGHIVQKNIEAKGGLLPESFTTYNIIEPGDIIIRPTDLQNDKRSLRTGLSNEHGIITSAYIDLEPLKNVNSKYYHYLLHSYDIQKVFYNMGNGVRQGLNYSEFSKLRVLAPKSIEQQQIADYLDHKTVEIDGLIDKINTEIDTLKQYQSSVITRAVTKGLDPNVPMKDSGIEWIGEIPASWKVARGKNILKLLSRKVEPDYEIITAFRDGQVTLRKNRRTEGFTISTKEIGYQGVKANDLVVHAMDGFAGAIGISDADGKASPVLNVLDSNQNKRYVMYYLRVCALLGVFQALAKGIRIRTADTRWDTLKNLNYLLPSKAEQQKIVDYLDQKVSQIQKVIKSKQQQINQLIEYKNSLIFEYVTGKK